MVRFSLTRTLLTLALAGSLGACAQQPAHSTAPDPALSGQTTAPDPALSDQPTGPDPELSDGLIMATAWMQTSAEYAALSHQAFNLARMNLDRALDESPSAQSRPPAIIVDVDETVLDNTPYEAWLIASGENYASDSWHQWVEKASAVPTPGAKAFLDYANSRGVEVYYVTNRKASESDATLRNLRQVGFPDADAAHFLPRTDSSDKTARRQRVAQSHWVVLLMGDNLGDFSAGFDRETAQARRAAAEAQSDAFGSRYIVLPNPAYGAWEEAIYGGDWSLSDAEKLRALRNHMETWSGPSTP